MTKNEYTRYREYLADEYPICQICNHNPSEDTHHLFYGCYGANKEDKSLICVCRECHEYCHKFKKGSQIALEHIVISNWSKYDTVRK